MEMALPFSAAEAARIENHAARNHMSVVDFVRQSVMARIDDEETREAQNAIYAAEIEESRKQFAKGRFVTKTWEELTQLAPE